MCNTSHISTKTFLSQIQTAAPKGAPSSRLIHRKMGIFRHDDQPQRLGGGPNAGHNDPITDSKYPLEVK
jgi:hypothetical protein